MMSTSGGSWRAGGNWTEVREAVGVAVGGSACSYVTDGRSGSTGLGYRLDDIFGLGHIEYIRSAEVHMDRHDAERKNVY